MQLTKPSYLAFAFAINPPHPIIRVIILWSEETFLTIDVPYCLHQTITVTLLTLKAVWVAASLVIADEVGFACYLDNDLMYINTNGDINLFSFACMA